MLKIYFVLFCASVISSGFAQNEFELPIIHLNDFHARFDEESTKSTTCKPEEGPCIGGIARIYTTVTSLQDEYPHSIFLNAGDNFQGTLWYNTYRWNVTAYFMNFFNTDAFTLGNHEFDHKIEGVTPFMAALNAPVLLCNVDPEDEPTFTEYEKSIVINRLGRKIGIIGVILKTTNEIASTGKLKFLDEAESVKKEAAYLTDEENVDIIIVLSHCGIDVDKHIAANAGPNIDVIVGGHSHTFMFTGEDSPGPDIPADDYPYVVNNEDHKVLIVQASAYTKYLGFLKVIFDSDGHVLRYSGAPIYMDTNVPQDPFIMNELIPWRQAVDEAGKEVLGVSKVDLRKSGCNTGECNIGSFIADAFVHAVATEEDEEDDGWNYATISVINVGGIRTQIGKGSVTYNDLVTAQPFENTLDKLELQGKHVLEMLEYAATKSFDEDKFNGQHILQVSGIRVVLNVTNPVGSRVQSLKVLCRKCEIPEYEDLRPEEWYRMIVPSFIAGGGDGFYVIPNNRRNHIPGEIDLEGLKRYITRESPIIKGLDGRLQVVT